MFPNSYDSLIIQYSVPKYSSPLSLICDASIKFRQVLFRHQKVDTCLIQLHFFDFVYPKVMEINRHLDVKGSRIFDDSKTSF